MFVAYNLRRLINIIDKTEFKKFLQELAFIFVGYKDYLDRFIYKLERYFLKQYLLLNIISVAQ